MQKPCDGLWSKHWNRRGYQSFTLNDQVKASWVTNMMCRMVSKNECQVRLFNQFLLRNASMDGFSKEIARRHILGDCKCMLQRGLVLGTLFSPYREANSSVPNLAHCCEAINTVGLIGPSSIVPYAISCNVTISKACFLRASLFSFCAL
ncbi:hypothetical protein TorRG33x02_174610 [Trema orientale]|uniref:Uncharacterized protein n=1 Tax=Trema orientale TaxID=63057 RepID=A0A2P5EMD0_TREOI|nr:hypothetical protein TorRG33x02_174610 [Trema orientale]